MKVEVDPTNKIEECDESDNSITASFQLKPIYIPTIYIDHVKSDYFPNPGVPYDFSINLRSSDDVTVPNASMMLTEQNGVDLFGPTQIFNLTYNGSHVKSGVKTVNNIFFRTDEAGGNEFTVIPTGNKLYSPEYSYLNLSSYVDDYKIYLSGKTQSGNNLVFLVNGNISNIYPLGITNPYVYANATTHKVVLNKNSFVQQILDYGYEIFSMFWKTNN